MGEAVLSQVILKTKTPVNIIRANVDYGSGILVVSISGDAKKEEEFISHVKQYGIEVEELSGKVFKDEKLCTDCGLCVGVCPTDAIKFEKNNAVKISNNDCVQCRACVEACPFGAVKIQDF
jgi:ferredoxin